MTGPSATARKRIDFPFVSCDRAIGNSAPIIPIENDQIHLWGYRLDGTATSIERCHGWLDPSEQARAARFIRLLDRTRFIQAHGLLRTVLASYVACRPETIRFGYGRHGKPFLLERETADSSIKFNMAHSNGRMLVGVTKEHEIGIDLEQARDGVEILKLAERFYAKSEHAALARMPASDQPIRFFKYWVAKEAVLKGQGVGLQSLQECELIPSSDDCHALVRTTSGSTLQPDWTVRWLPCGNEWAGALARQGSHWKLTIIDINS
ncbi:putative 4'-phosphopantetheinyl transferase HetI [Nitrospira sp. KM1]|uniref:4'-phosphopantetheinyl transferase family protein n=1 Tax=Nitrospira sp. KM1 TaxID=1936990 RepID=UPI0013A73DD8|nr:4'-phosphopantetheinyl transferase superfamily protein [Nitrospira sp. KM1]BCA53185.1 putative 4'-phosphopantetheinyl transferase HetI [Nitrospira sp. KM1]